MSVVINRDHVGIHEDGYDRDVARCVKLLRNALGAKDYFDVYSFQADRGL